MDHGFNTRHFALLAELSGQVRRDGDVRQDAAYAELVQAYEATAEWAHALQRKLFPEGVVRKLSKPTDQWRQKFKPYTWTRVYPRQNATRHLAYTVGIDAEGFCVKIDTVSAPDSVRSIYDQLSRYDHRLSPFASIASPQLGLSWTLDQLVDWSIEAIGRFEPGYDEISRRLGLATGALHLVTNKEMSRRSFDYWRSAIVENADGSGPVPRIVQQDVWFVERDGEGGAEIKAGLDPLGSEWAVELNAPPEPGNYNRLTAMATDETGGLHLLRQGWLRGRRPASDIRVPEFISSTGLKPVSVVAEGKAAERSWFLVADLSDPPARIRRTTAAFVELCWAARTPVQTQAEGEGTGARIGGTESDQPYLLPARPALDPRIVEQMHGRVWQTLATALSAKKVGYRKWRRAGGFSIDMEVARENGWPLLIEIKTGCSTSDVHTAVGQLMLYRKLFPNLSGHKPVLLIDAILSGAIASAVAALNIEVHQYQWTGEGDARSPIFSNAFRELCGLV
ncbi:hypothetical protein [Rhizobium brockwellii]|uniref:hypothetical protein n=1 Tax=Rhizobium brockwellii TaxID=3019932 RepID=UPI0005230517|nr:hypothetical protein [Rhizobium brockwellii]KPN22718.1 hypothetical protein KS05_32070 [Rhizobium brockwellii]QJX09964.1 hypothetical protein RLCC275e_33850 [Rhizobium brockwellii]